MKGEPKVNTKLAVFMLSLLTLFGCSSVPIGQKMITAPQKKMQAAKHWDLLAENIARRIKSSTVNDRDLAYRNVYLNTDDTSAFGSTFKELIRYHLFKSDIRVVDSPDGAIELTYKTTILNHNADRVSGDWVYQEELALGAAYLGTGAAFGLAAVYNAVDYSSRANLQAALTGTAIAFGAAGVVQSLIYSQFTGITNTEMIFAAEMRADGKLCDMFVDIYYINPEDVRQYIAAAHKKFIEGSPPLRGKSIKIVGDSQRKIKN